MDARELRAEAEAGLEKPKRGSPLNGGGPGGDAELHVGVSEVGLYRVEGEVQVRCHVEVRQTLRQFLQDAYFGVSERVAEPCPAGTGRRQLPGLEAGADQRPQVVRARVAGRP